MRTFCVDAGLLIALYDERDPLHRAAVDYFDHYIDNSPCQLVVPWPILYEAVSTRMAREQRRIDMLRRHWDALSRMQKLVLLDDSPYRDAAVDECFREVGRGPHYRALSLVDRVIRGVLSDVNVRVDAFVTFNSRDFWDVCGHTECVVP